MKITKEQLKRIIKEELSAIMEEPDMKKINFDFDSDKNKNQLIDNHGYEVYLQAPLYIKGDFSSPLDGPWNQAEAVKQALRGGSGVDANRGLKAVNNLEMMTSQGHPSINPNKKKEIMDFLKHAFNVLSRS